MNSGGVTVPPEEKVPGIRAILITVLALVLLGLFSPIGLNIPLASLMMQVVVISIVIWQACDPFAEAAQWVGDRLRLPGSVRGATLDAVASSMPELFTGLFFVLLAISGTDVAAEGFEETGPEGFRSTLATCVGSAIFNMILIPALCAITISIFRKKRPAINVDREVIVRDGFWFLACEAVLIAFLLQGQVHWWMGAVLLVMYCAYVFKLYVDARSYRIAIKAIHAHLGHIGEETPTETIVETLQAAGIRTTTRLVDEIRHSEQDGDKPQSAEAFYGLFEIRLNGLSATLILLIATIIAATACYWLVEVTTHTAEVLDVPIFFVAVILAAAASSVPDTLLSIGAAMRGDDSGAVSNAFGSNIFDICVCLAIPLILNTALIGWQPVDLASDKAAFEGIVVLQILLAAMSVITLGILWHKRQLTRLKGIMLCALYGVFIAYAVLGSMNITASGLLGLE